MKKQTLEIFLKDNPQYNHRKHIPTIVEAITGVPPEKQIEVKVAIRRLQELIPNDAKGKRLEAEWRDGRGMKSQSEFVSEQAWESAFGNTLRTLENLTIR